MDSDDHFSPPLGGIARGKKISQVLCALQASSAVIQADPGNEVDADVIAVLDLEEILKEEIALLEYEIERAAVLQCSWWHMSMEEDWWEFKYLELGRIDQDADEAPDTGENSASVLLHQMATWGREERDELDGNTYFQQVQPDKMEGGEDVELEMHIEPFNPPAEAARPLTRAMIDSIVPEYIRSGY